LIDLATPAACALFSTVGNPELLTNLAERDKTAIETLYCNLSVHRFSLRSQNFNRRSRPLTYAALVQNPTCFLPFFFSIAVLLSTAILQLLQARTTASLCACATCSLA
jgi:hypothetical protein